MKEYLFIGFQFALQYQLVIGGALKKAHVYKSREDYHDFFTEGLIVYARCYQNYDKTNFDIDRFHNYVFTKIVWKAIDLLRKEKMRKEYHWLHDFEGLEFCEEEKVNRMEILHGLDLTDLEEIILETYFINGDSLTIIAEKTGFSARYLRKVRSKLVEKLRTNYQDDK